MCNQREMTLQEWVDELPEFHLAHKEYDTLRTQRDRAVELLQLAVELPGDMIEIMQQQDIKIEDLDDKMQKMLMTYHSEAVNISNKADALLAEIDGR